MKKLVLLAVLLLLAGVAVILLLRPPGFPGEAVPDSPWKPGEGAAPVEEVLGLIGGGWPARQVDGEGRIHASAAGGEVILKDLETGRELRTAGFLAAWDGRRFCIFRNSDHTVRVVAPGPTLADPIRVGGNMLWAKASPDGRWLAIRMVQADRTPPLSWVQGPRKHRKLGVCVIDLLEPRIVVSSQIQPNAVFDFTEDGKALVVLEKPKPRYWVLGEEGE